MNHLHPDHRMSLLKRPPLRSKVGTFSCKLVPGDPLYDRIHSCIGDECVAPRRPDDRMRVVRPVYNQEDYLRLLKRNYNFYGLQMKDLKLPPMTTYVKPYVQEEPDIQFYDRVYLMTQILKNGRVKIKLNAGMADLYEKYFKYNQHPPQKSIIKVYRSLGFSETLIKKIERSYKRIPSRLVAFQSCIDKIFNKPSVSKPKKKKVEPLPDMTDEPDELIKDEVVEEDIDEDDDPGEDGEMDVEVEVEEEVEEEFIDND